MDPHDDEDSKALRPEIGAGLIAGAAGGLVAGIVKLAWEVPFPPRPPGRDPEPAVLLEKTLHRKPPGWGTLAVHFAFSIVSGAMYGAMVEIDPRASAGFGTAYGTAVWVGAHEVAMPKMGLTPPATELPLREQVSEFFGHAAWGASLEAVRRVVRARG